MRCPSNRRDWRWPRDYIDWLRVLHFDDIRLIFQSYISLKFHTPEHWHWRAFESKTGFIGVCHRGTKATNTKRRYCNIETFWHSCILYKDILLEGTSFETVAMDNDRSICGDYIFVCQIPLITKQRWRGLKSDIICRFIKEANLLTRNRLRDKYSIRGRRIGR